MSEERIIPHDEIPTDPIPESEGPSEEEDKNASRARWVYCNSARIVNFKEWHYLRDTRYAQDDERGVCGTDFRTLKYDKTDQLTALGHCEPKTKKRGKVKISW